MHVTRGSGWLTGKEIKRQVLKKKIFIEPFNETQTNPNSYNYRLSPKIKRLKNKIIDLKKEDQYDELEITEGGLMLLPGECYLGSTVEKFGSDTFASLVTGRSSVGRKFVTNHITAGLVDQGFFGNITLEITVQRPTIIYPNIIFGQIFWFEVKGSCDLYNGKYQNQVGATPSKIYIDFLNQK